MAMLMMLMANAYGNAHDAYGKCLWQFMMLMAYSKFHDAYGLDAKRTP